MGFAVFHASRGKGSGAKLGAHIDRLPGQEHSYKNADPLRRNLNSNYKVGKYSLLPLAQAIETRIQDSYKGKKAIRKDAVKFLPMVLTGTHEDMKEIFSDPEKSKKWIKANYDFLAKEFGKENILRFALHMDEKTPHLHAIIAPITSDGRLSAKEIMGDIKKLSERQTRYAIAMQEFGLVRGVKGSKSVHNSEGWYLGQQKKEQESFLSDVTNFSLIERINPLAKIEKLTEGIKTAIKLKVDSDLEVQRRTAQEQQRAKNETAAKLAEAAALHREKTALSNLEIAKYKLNGYNLKPEYEERLQILLKQQKDDLLKQQQEEINKREILKKQQEERLKKEEKQPEEIKQKKRGFRP